MKKLVYEIDDMGYIVGRYVKEFDEEGIPVEELAEDNITTQLPDGLYHAKWTGIEWIEVMTQEEINELNKLQIKEPTFEELQVEYNVDLDYRLSLIEMGLM